MTTRIDTPSGLYEEPKDVQDPAPRARAISDALAGFDPARQDPGYRDGLAALQTGDWLGAKNAFEKLKVAYPDSPLPEQMLQEVALRLGTKKQRRVRGRIVTLRLWPILLRLALVALIGGLVYTGARMLNDVVKPMMAEAREKQAADQTMMEALAFLEGGNFEAAEARFATILEDDPENPQALESLAYIAGEREITTLYAQAVDLDAAGDTEGAMALYQELDELRPGYRDIERRMETIERAWSLARLYDEATAAFDAGNEPEAIRLYEAVRDVNLSYNQGLIEDRLFKLYLDQGTRIIEQDPPVVGELPTAFNYLSKALALRPRSQVAGRERQIVKLFLDAQAAYYDERWTEAASLLRVIYDTRPSYLGTTVLNLLYDAYVRSGDEYKAAGDSFLAYEQYRKAMELPVEDTTFAQGRMFYVQPFLTPTATPTPTPTPRAAAAFGSGPPATRRELSDYRGKIVFMADYPNRGEIWVMDPDGQNRQRLGREWDLIEQFEALQDAERYSPDRSRFAFVQAPPNSDAPPQVFLTIPPKLRVDGQWFIQLVSLDDLCYDPVWSPDGTRVAFVTPAIDSDDIWVINVDGSNAQPLTANPWEWDRHPTWSPESDRIAFWSNRTGLMQLYVMKADGTEVVNISNTEWDEYDPVWVK